MSCQNRGCLLCRCQIRPHTQFSRCGCALHQVHSLRINCSAGVWSSHHDCYRFARNTSTQTPKRVADPSELMCFLPLCVLSAACFFFPSRAFTRTSARIRQAFSLQNALSTLTSTCSRIRCDSVCIYDLLCVFTRFETAKSASWLSARRSFRSFASPEGRRNSCEFLFSREAGTTAVALNGVVRWGSPGCIVGTLGPFRRAIV